MAKIYEIENELVSEHIGYTGLIFTAWLCGVFFLARIFSAQILPWFFGKKFTCLSDRDRRSVTFHSTATVLKFIVFAALIYPFVEIVFLDAGFSDTVAENGTVTYGDMLLVIGNLFASMFILELYYRADEISYLSVMHHVGTVIIGQLALSMGAQPDRYPEAAIELYMCTVWAMFEILAYLTLDPILVARKFYKEHYPVLIRNLLASTGIWSLAMTLTEIIVTIYLLHESWLLWGLSFKVLIPLVFSMWCITQLWFCKTVYGMWMVQGRVTRKTGSVSTDEETLRRASSTGTEMDSLRKGGDIVLDVKEERCSVCSLCRCQYGH